MSAPHSTCTIDGCEKKALARGWCSKHYTRWKTKGSPLAMKAASNGERMAAAQAIAKRRGESDCIIWPFPRPASGYGKLSFSDGRGIVASRFICSLVHGEPPTPEHQAAHRCGQGHAGCVNPDHLRWASPAENSADRVQHGTSNRGSRHGIAKLREGDVREIRRLLRAGTVQTTIAERYGVTQTTVANINNRKTWGWLDA